MSEHSPEATQLAERELQAGCDASRQETQRPQRSRGATITLLMISLIHQHIGAPYPARGYMFIARLNPHLRRRSEERVASYMLRANIVPASSNGAGVALESWL